MTRFGLAAKHTVDFVLALIGVICVLPVIILVAVCVKLDSPGPVFFCQYRAGLDGRPFPMIKFRGMRDDAEKGALIQVMARVDGNVAKAAELLGISRPTLYDLLNRFGL